MHPTEDNTPNTSDADRNQNKDNLSIDSNVTNYLIFQQFFIMDFSILDFVKLSSDIKTQFSVEFDIYSPKDYTIEPQSHVVIPTGWQVKIPQGYYGCLCSKSGLAMKHSIHVGAGIMIQVILVKFKFCY